MTNPSELFVDFQWRVSAAHDWKDWLDARGKPVSPFPKDWMETPAAVVLAFNHAVEHRQQTGPVLGEREGASKPYRPMQREHSALYRTFAALDYQDRDAIRAFANAYGLLGVPQQVQHVFVGRSQKAHTAVGEPHLVWAFEICLMQEAIWFADTRPKLRTQPDDRGRLDWLFKRQLQYVRVQPPNLDSASPRFSIQPLTLLSAMWLQLSLALTGGKRWIACKFCRRALEISTEGSGFRRHREFCSDVCKTKDYRRRKYTALKLATEGLSVAEIADRTDTKRTTIRKWLSGRSTRRTARAGD